MVVRVVEVFLQGVLGVDLHVLQREQTLRVLLVVKVVVLRALGGQLLVHV